jgi:chromosome segregation ATPase
MAQLANSVRQLAGAVRDDEKRKREFAGRSESLAPAVRALEQAGQQLGNAGRQLEGVIAQQTAQTQEGLLDEYQQAHAERNLYFNRKHEQKEISGLPIDKAREYLQEGLEGRIERQQARDSGLEGRAEPIYH